MLFQDNVYWKYVTYKMYRNHLRISSRTSILKEKKPKQKAPAHEATWNLLSLLKTNKQAKLK